MKKEILLSVLMILAISGTYAQTVNRPGKLKEAVLRPIKNAPVKNTAPAQFPDLVIVSFDANYLGPQVVDGVTKNLVQITYTIKNEGTAGVMANLVGWQGWVGYDSGNPKLIPGGGSAISVSPTDVINPGETRQRSFRVTVAFDKNNHPLYTMYLDDLNTVKESNEQNNIMQKAILF